MVFVSCRRYYIDECFSKIKFFGKVLDIGGKKHKKRGSFRPPLENIESWRYLNVSKATGPDYCCCAENIPIENEYFDMVVMAEVLEHLKDPAIVLKEIYRILKKEGKVIASMPFLFPMHADPEDYQRWTPEKIKIEFEKNGFVIEKIEPMGNVFAVIYDLLCMSFSVSGNKQVSFVDKIFDKYIKSFVSKIFLFLDKNYKHKTGIITTGYFIVAHKDKIFLSKGGS